MADNLTPITSDQLPKVTTAQDTDLVTLGINGNFVSMTLANLKEVLGINALNTKIGAITTEYFTHNDTAIWVTPGTYILLMNYSVSGTGQLDLNFYNFTDAESLGFALNFSSPSAERGDIVRAISVEESKQIGIHITGSGSLNSIGVQVTSVQLK